MSAHSRISSYVDYYLGELRDALNESIGGDRATLEEIESLLSDIGLEDLWIHLEPDLVHD